MRIGPTDFVSSRIRPFVTLLAQAVELCPDHHLVTMGAIIETVDLLCNVLPGPRAKNIRRDIFHLQRLLNNAKAETVDSLLEQVEAQRELLRQSQDTINALRAQLVCAAESKPPLASLDISSVRDHRGDGPGIAGSRSVGKVAVDRACACCGKFVVKSGFSNTQWRKSVGGKCLLCAAVSFSLSSPTPPFSSPTSAVASSDAVDSTTAPDTFSFPLSSPTLAMTLSVPCARSLDAIGSPATMFATFQAQPEPCSTALSSLSSPFCSPEKPYTALQSNDTVRAVDVVPRSKERGSEGVDRVVSKQG